MTGRKKTIGKIKLTNVSIKMTDEEIKQLRTLGEGYTTRGVRRLLELTYDLIPSILEERHKMNQSLKLKL